MTVLKYQIRYLDLLHLHRRNLIIILEKKAFQLAVKHNVDMIFTYVAAFELQKEIDYLKNLENQFIKSGGKFYFCGA